MLWITTNLWSILILMQPVITLNKADTLQGYLPQHKNI
jgi:hypothetical protein